MTFHSTIGIGNNVELGCDHVVVETGCIGFITLHIPRPGLTEPLKIELSRQDLREFLARTCPAFTTTESYDVRRKEGA